MKQLAKFSVAMAVVTMLSACVVVPARPVEAAYPSAGGVYTDVAPPAPRYDVVPVAPYVGAVWIGGYWNWHLGRHLWVPGYWSRPHAHGHAWAPHRWVHTPRGWSLQGGHWRR